MTELFLVALGSNLPDVAGHTPLDICRRAVAALAAHPCLTLRAVSPWYRTRPIPASDQPDYVNGAASLTGDLDPVSILAILHDLEAEAGRTRSVPNAARVLDLDLLAAGARIVRTPTLTLPHPRLQDRAFVLDPLCDIAPDWTHPLLGRTARQLRDALPTRDLLSCAPVIT